MDGKNGWQMNVTHGIVCKPKTHSDLMKKPIHLLTRSLHDTAIQQKKPRKVKIIGRRRRVKVGEETTMIGTSSYQYSNSPLIATF